MQAPLNLLMMCAAIKLDRRKAAWPFASETRTGCTAHCALPPGALASCTLCHGDATSNETETLTERMLRDNTDGRRVTKHGTQFGATELYSVAWSITIYKTPAMIEYNAKWLMTQR